MGQQIEVATSVVGDAAIFDTDRSITGQDGVSFNSADAAAGDDSFPSVMAQRLFSTDGAVTTVFVASNTVTIGRNGGWDEGSLARATEVISDFFLFYDGEEE